MKISVRERDLEVICISHRDNEHHQGACVANQDKQRVRTASGDPHVPGTGRGGGASREWRMWHMEDKESESFNLG